MNITLEQLIKETEGMNPVQFEAHCEANNIQIEWLDVCLSNFNDDYYNVSLPGYNDANVFAFNGSPIEIND